MRIESTEGNEYKVWLTDGEIEDLRRATNSQRDDIIIQLGSFVGLRAFEIPQVRPVDVKETESGQYRLRVEAEKDTSGNGGKPRDAYLPDSVERDLQRYQNEHNIAPKDPLTAFLDAFCTASIGSGQLTLAITPDEETSQFVGAHLGETLTADG